MIAIKYRFTLWISLLVLLCSTCEYNSPIATIGILPTPTMGEDMETEMPSASITLAANEAERLIAQMLSDSSGCALPCWWGIRPGITTWQEANQILERFMPLFRGYEFREGESGTLALEIPGNETRFRIIYAAKDGKIQILHVLTQIVPEVYPLVIDPTHPYFSLMMSYSLANILKNLGKPELIFIKSFNINPYGIPTHTQLYYPELGLLLEYASPTDYRFRPDGSLVAFTCPTTGFVNFRLFDPKGGLTIRELLNYYDEFALYKEIGSVSNMSVTEFVNHYKEGNCDVNIETMAETWPNVDDTSGQ